MKYSVVGKVHGASYCETSKRYNVRISGGKKNGGRNHGSHTTEAEAAFAYNFLVLNRPPELPRPRFRNCYVTAYFLLGVHRCIVRLICRYLSCLKKISALKLSTYSLLARKMTKPRTDFAVAYRLPPVTSINTTTTRAAPMNETTGSEIKASKLAVDITDTLKPYYYLTECFPQWKTRLTPCFPRY